MGGSFKSALPHSANRDNQTHTLVQVNKVKKALPLSLMTLSKVNLKVEKIVGPFSACLLNVNAMCRAISLCPSVLLTSMPNI